MIRESSQERRVHPRFSHIMEMRGTELSSLQSPEERKPTTQGWIQDIGQGGVCFVSDKPMTLFALVRGEIVVSNSAVSIPTLMQVRWTGEMSAGQRCKIGLQFLI